jgi:hypothetical protein
MTEISVNDSRFRQILQGIGTIEQDLDPGLYEVEFRVGDTAHSEYAVLEPGEESVTIEGPELAFSTPAPIFGTQTAREYHRGPAQRLSTPTVIPKDASTSGIFIFVRDLEPIGRPKNPASGVSLLNVDGDELISEYSEWDHDIKHQWAGISLPLEPGSYRLRVRTQVAGILERILVARPHWQTQLFMDQRSFHRLGKRTSRRADLLNASVLMTPLSDWSDDSFVFDPDRADFRQTEIARLGLANRRMVMPERTLQDMVWAQNRNPMLGLYGGHMLLLSEQPDVQLLEATVNGLRELVGDHPDVQALEIKLAELKGETLRQMPTFQIPPMLHSSWQIVVNASAHYPKLVPAGSLFAEISDRIWAEGAWLVWRNLRTRKRANPIDPSALANVLPQLTDHFADTDWLADVATRTDLDNAERSLLSYLKSVIDRTQYRAGPQFHVSPADQGFAEEVTIAVEPAFYLTEDVLIEALNLPSATVAEAAAGLVQKLNLKP